MRRLSPLVSFGMLAGLACGCAAGHGDGLRARSPGSALSAVVYQNAPAVVPASRQRGRVCITPGSQVTPASHGRLVSVDPHPVGVTLVWLPGLNQRPCRSVMTRENAPVASRLQAELDAARAFPHRAINCPMDDGAAVDLYFDYDHGLSEFVQVGLAGCAPAVAPHRTARMGFGALVAELLAIAPPAWLPRTRIGG
jgi:hypothetical protein